MAERLLMLSPLPPIACDDCCDCYYVYYEYEDGPNKKVWLACACCEKGYHNLEAAADNQIDEANGVITGVDRLIERALNG